MTMRLYSILALAFALAASPALAQEPVDRPGKGDWCYNPVRSPSRADRIAFIKDISPGAIRAERRWGVPAPIIAAMGIVESGFGTTRIAIKSNNIFAYKWPGATIAAGLQRFVLWCQPDWDKGNVYPAFKTRADAVEFVGSRLRKSKYYSRATKSYMSDIVDGKDRKNAALSWLATIAPTYNHNGKEYFKVVAAFADNPVGDYSMSLWDLKP
ncbi:glucosaminidase domain-containing protein [Hansschlegelia sp. KR7-227]|uniref:glucosaminidase domain-containing protein n=1 Tax=Hansschlegelia sp. KR7-227 TaxID=3400914 RepID=UPI003C02D7F6